MDRDAFDALYDSCMELIPPKTKYHREVLAVLLDWLGRGASCRGQEIKFKMAFSTIHRYRRVDLHAVIKTLSHSIVMPRTVPTWFAEAFTYFDQAVGAINGVHIPVVVATQDRERFETGRGSTAHIADAGYALQPQALTPYRGVLYHLKEWAAESGRPKTAKELYNLSHAKARNVVERVNGILKRRFKILRVPIEFEFIVAKAVVFASACLHNFIRQHNADDHAMDLSDEEDSQEDRNEGDDERCADDIEVYPFDFSSASNWRDWMAAAM
ncbi:unnamed protein product [Phytophthora fragariaefolia]|uniref:Unnamed protein product n=1 Tax=Phytophthora fragariaefolia TaxID=1490495 RepID=A0A9W7CXJ3_9STRA|nr:unnamed protein product [Phytophthora fragariaefolia]